MAATDTTRLSLLLRLRNRSDKLSWAQFHDRYGELLYRYARSRGAGHADAEDLVQEVELALFKAMDGFEYDVRKGRFRGYLRCAIIHAMGRRASKLAHEQPGLDPHTMENLAESDAGDAEWNREWQLHRLRWALREVAAEFESKTLEAFQLHVMQGLSVDETADRLEMGKASVYQSKSRVLKRVKEKLDSLDPDAEV
jgi:RNA polymerase sigma-70 factor (ECF subfamily)